VRGVLTVADYGLESHPSGKPFRKLSTNQDEGDGRFAARVVHKRCVTACTFVRAGAAIFTSRRASGVGREELCPVLPELTVRMP
jgi:hypothetical protein